VKGRLSICKDDVGNKITKEKEKLERGTSSTLVKCLLAYAVI